MFIDVNYYRDPWWATMNILIYPSPADRGKVEGLCGNFNGDQYDDLVHSDGSLTDVVYEYYYFWWWVWWYFPDPNSFSASWGYVSFIE